MSYFGICCENRYHAHNYPEMQIKRFRVKRFNDIIYIRMTVMALGMDLLQNMIFDGRGVNGGHLFLVKPLFGNRW